MGGGSWGRMFGPKGEEAVRALVASRKGKPRVTLEEQVAMWLRKMGLIHDFSCKANCEPSKRI